MPTTIEQLKRAIQLTDQIDQLQSELDQIFAGFEAGNGLLPEPPKPAVAKRGRKRGSKMSAAGRAAVAAAQKARWAKIKAAKGSSASAKLAAAPKAKAKGKRTLSPETRAKIVAAQKKRWAKVRKRA